MPPRSRSPFDKLPAELLLHILSFTVTARWEAVEVFDKNTALLNEQGHACSTVDGGSREGYQRGVRAFEEECDALQFAHERNRRCGERRLQYIVFDEVMLEHGGDVCSLDAVKRLSLAVMRRELAAQHARLRLRLRTKIGDAERSTPPEAGGAEAKREPAREMTEACCKDRTDVPFPVVHIVERSSTELLSILESLHPHWRCASRCPSSSSASSAVQSAK